MTKFLLGSAMVAALVAMAPAAAQTTPGPMAQQAPAMQVQTRAEVGARVATMFQRVDTNRDGFITRAESEAAKPQRGDRQARQMQRGANRSPEQRAANRATMFDRLDANRDGMISRDEFARSPAGGQERMAGRKGQPGMHGMGGMGMGGLRGHMFDMADVNRDGRVSLQEATAAAYKHFDTADANRDGQITREERMQVRQQMRGQRQPG